MCNSKQSQSPQQTLVHSGKRTPTFHSTVLQDFFHLAIPSPEEAITKMVLGLTPKGVLSPCPENVTVLPFSLI